MVEKRDQTKIIFLYQEMYNNFNLEIIEPSLSLSHKPRTPFLPHAASLVDPCNLQVEFVM